MQITATIPLEITVTSYFPGDPGRTSGPPENCYPPEPPEIEFEIRTLTGHELSESDFDAAEWDTLIDEVLAAHEAEIEDCRTEAAISAYEARQAAWDY